MILDVIIKQPEDVMDYDIDATPIFNNDESDYVTGVAFNCIPADAVEVSVAANGPNAVKVWISGGVDGVEATVEITATTYAGRVKQDELLVKVRDFV